MSIQYTELEYIESTGTQYINTGVSCNASNVEVHLKMRTGSSVSTQAILGGSWAANGFFLMLFNGMFRFHSGNSVITPASASPDTDYDIIANKSFLTINEDQYSINGGTDIEQSISLFSTTTGITYTQPRGSFKIYEAKIYVANEMVRDLIPAKRDSDDTLGLYDRVNDVFYTNNGTGTFIGGQPVVDTYTVLFNSNGGVGDSYTQEIEVDVPTTLLPNAFTRENYDFMGWSLSPNGNVLYTNEEEVLNLAEADETISLYAVWQLSPTSITLYYNKSDEDHVYKDITPYIVLTGTLRNDSSIINPYIRVESTEVIDSNYCYIPLWNRYYYIDEIISYRTNIYDLSLRVDPLMSFKDEIMELDVIINKQDSDYTNLYLDDGDWIMENKMFNEVYTFSNGFNNNGEFILIVAGA